MKYHLRIKNHYHQSDGINQLDAHVIVDLETTDRERAVTRANKYITRWVNEQFRWKAWNFGEHWGHSKHANYSSNDLFVFTEEPDTWHVYWCTIDAMGLNE